jgi:hypothetical protein
MRVVATTVRVGVRTVVALRMFSARPPFTRLCGECPKELLPAVAFSE